MARPRFEGLWSKWLLLPCWMIQMGGSIAFGISGVLLLLTAAYSEQLGEVTFYGYDMQDVITLARAEGAVVLAFSVLTFLFCLVEIVLYATRILNPAVVLAFACLKTLGWAAMIVVDVVAVGRDAGFPWSNFILSLALLVTALVQVSPMRASRQHPSTKNFDTNLCVLPFLQLCVSAKYTHHQRLAARDRGQYEKAGDVEAAGFAHANGNYIQVSTPKQQPFQQQDTEYRSPSPEDLAGARRDEMAASPLFNNRDYDSTPVVGARRTPGAAFFG
ncbi:hypothetical protein PG997_010337 [Apiospora hydei]|uniref:Uncharacterized protein n=1 Tax=Apiospora hydei TaxID=1337664 RepID=A0ABR1VWR7_9PEZI